MKGKNIIWFLLIIMFSAIAFGAGHEVIFEFNDPSGVKDAFVFAHTCTAQNNEGACTQLGAFPTNNGRSRIINANVHNDKVGILFPSNLATQYGYVLFFTAKDSNDNDYVPLEIRSYTQGNAKTRIKSSNNPLFKFKRIPLCSAEISSMNIEVANVDEPITIEADAEFDSTTKLAFRSGRIIPIPSQLTDLYSANTDINLVITKNAEQEYAPRAENYNLLVTQKVNPSWQWTPTEEGTYTAVITSRITDNKCIAVQDRFASENFQVSEEEPDTKCSASISNLRIVDNDVYEDTNFDLRFDWTANDFDDEPNGLEYDWEIIDDEENIVNSGHVYNTYNNPENKNLRAPSIGAEENNVQHTLKITVYPSDPECDAECDSESQEINFIVKQQQGKYDLNFNILRQSGTANVPLANAEIEILGIVDHNGDDVKANTNNDGRASFNLDAGTYDYRISKSNYRTRNGRVSLTGERYLTKTLYAGNDGNNQAPTIWLEDSYNILKGETLDINLDNYVTDDSDDPELLEWFVNHAKTYNGDFVSITIDENMAHIRAGNTEDSESVPFNVKDTQDAETQKTITFNVIGNDETPPVWNEEKLQKITPIQFSEEDNAQPNALYLPVYARDDRNSPTELTFSLELEFPNEYNHIPTEDLVTAAGITINENNNLFLSIVPDGDFFGLVDVTLTAEDMSGNSADTTIQVNITNVNDAPTTKQELTSIIFNDKENLYELDLTEYFFDIDEYYDSAIDELRYGVTQTRHSTLVIDQNANTLTITSNDGRAHEEEFFNLWATDLEGERVSFIDVSLIITEGNDAPEITGLFTEVRMTEDDPENEMTINAGQDGVQTFTRYALVGFANDEETDQGDLIWSVENGYNTNLITVNISEDPQKYLTITTKPDAWGHTDVTLKVEDEGGAFDTHQFHVEVAGVNDAPTIEDITKKTVQVDKEFSYQVEAEDIDGDELIYVAEIDPSKDWFDMESIDPFTGLLTFTPENLGNYTITIIVADETLNVDTTFELEVVDAQPVFGTLTEPTDTDYNANATYTWTAEVSHENSEIATIDRVELTVKDGATYDETFYAYINADGIYEVVIPLVDGTSTSGTNNLDVGTYTYSWKATDTNENEVSTANKDLVISKANPVMSLTVDGEEYNSTNIQEFLTIDQIDIVGTLTAPATGNLKLWVREELNPEVLLLQELNGSIISKNNHTFNEGNFTIRFEYIDTTNATNYKTTHSINHTVRVSVDDIGPEFDEDNATKPENGAFREFNEDDPYPIWTMRITDVLQEVNANTVRLVFTSASDTIRYVPEPLGDNTYRYANVGSLQVGDYSYYWTAEDASGNSANSDVNNLIISKADPEITVLFEDAEAKNITIEKGETVRIRATTVKQITQNITIFVDGDSKAEGNSEFPIQFTLTDTNDEGIHYIIVSKEVEQNYEAFEENYTITVRHFPVQSNYTPTSGTDIEFNYVDLSFDTDISTSCKWSLEDEAYADMINDFAGDTHHTGRISGFVVEDLNDLRLHNFHVACEEETITSNDDLTFNIKNLLNGTIFTGSNTNTLSIVTDNNVTDSTITDSIVRESTIIDSNINGSTINFCSLDNVTFRGGSNCFHSSIRDASVGCDLMGNTIIGGDIDEHSNLIDSYSYYNYIKGSNIQDSRLIYSTITNSNITNSILIEDVEINNAIIVDDIITSGTITYKGITYDAGTEEDGIEFDLSDFIIVSSPTAVIKYSPVAPETNQIINFDGSDSSSPGSAAALTYAWNFGDGSAIGTEEILTHTYTTAETYTVTLTVTNAANKIGIDTAQIVVKEAQINTTTPPITPPVVRNSGGGGGGGGSSRMQSVTVTREGTEMTFRTYDLLRFNINNNVYPVMISLYKLDTDKVTFMFNGKRYELNKGETKEFDLNRDGISDVSITGITLTKSSATLRFLPAGVKQQFATPPMPMFDIPPQDTPTTKEEPKTEEKIETEEVEINAQVGSTWDKLVNSFKKLFGATEGQAEDVGGSGWIAMLIIAGVISIGIGIFFVVKKVYFY